MGEYLSTPITDKDISDGENQKVRNPIKQQYKFGACGMQGWRKNMEDTHVTELTLAPDVALFGVFDGHGGRYI